MKRLIFFCWATILVACEPGDLVDLPGTTAKITIMSFNEVGKPWTVVLSRSTPGMLYPGLYGAAFPKGLPDAKVSIYEDNNFIETLERDTTRSGSNPWHSPDDYPSTFRSKNNSPRVGHEYKLVVEAEGYPTATSTYVQPHPVEADFLFELRSREPRQQQVFNSDGTVTTDTVYVTKFDVTIIFTDPPGDNFYDFWIKISDIENIDEAKYQYSSFLTVEYLGQNGNSFVDPIIDDKIISGKRTTHRFLESVNDHPFRQGDVPMPEWFQVSLRTTTDAVYKYITQTRKSRVSEYDPYAQPITTFTNVENGLGVFGGYTPYSKTFHYKIQE